jgi:hypothetical protein
MTFLEHLEQLRETKKEDGEDYQKEYDKLPYDAKKVATALKEPWKRNILNKREMIAFEDFRSAFTQTVLNGIKLKELTENDAEVLKNLGFKVGGKKEDDGYTIYTTYSK